jgi:predicted Zn-dependent protease
MVLTFLVSFLLFLDDWVTFWNGENTIAWTLFFQMFVVMVLNGVFPDGQFSAIQSKWLALALRATVLILPLHTILYGIFLYGKFQSTGWTVGLFWEIFLAGVVGLCVLGYALSSFYPLEKWMNGIGAVNVGAGALVIILLGLVNTPFLDPKPMTISSQVKRLMSNEIHPDVFNYYNLGMRLGKLGQSHLAQLTHLEEHPNAQLIRKNAVNSISNMGCHNKPDFLSTPVKPKKPERGKIYLIPLDEEAKLIVSKMIPYYQKNYSLTVHSLSNHSGIDEDDLYNMILNWDRNQLIAEEMIGALKRLFPNLAQDPNAILIGITSDDMYIRKYRWRFAFAYRDANRFAIISTARMEPLWYGTTEDPIIFHQRARKMVSRYIGFMYYGLNTNNDKHSVLCNSIGGIEDLDTIGEWF